MDGHRYVYRSSNSSWLKGSKRSQSSPQFSCECCGLPFRRGEDLAYHLIASFMLDKYVVEYLLSSLGVSNEEMSDHANIPLCESSPAYPDPKPKFECESCKKKFVSDRGLRQHIGKMHKTEEYSFLCEKCNKTFKHKHALKFHIQQVHEKKNKARCKECKKYFYNKYQLKFHIQKKHSSAI